MGTKRRRANSETTVPIDGRRSPKTTRFLGALTDSQTPAATTPCMASGRQRVDLETAQVHHLRPCRDEVVDE